MLNTNIKSYVCGGDSVEDELQLARNEINEGTNLMEEVYESLDKHADVLMDCGLENLIETARLALEKTEVGRMSIERLLEERK